MFIGHFAVGFGAKSLDKRVSLGTYFLAAQFVDLLWPIFLLIGIEHVQIEKGVTRMMPLDFISYPFSHSLIFVCFWGALFALVYGFLRRNSKGAVILGLCVVSHWFLDVLVHRPDLPIHPGRSPMFGLGLWNSIAGTLLVEGAIFVGGIYLYLRSTKAANRVGSVGLWTLVGFLVVVYLGNVFGPLPPSGEAIAWAGQSQWLLIVWAYWVDRNRSII